ncbi:MAG: chemotaxis protein CheW [Lachnospiraceae bacterium]|jgi:purine-binding chemotaxis protein CheW|uniref:chemotaxis protein CheW n=1 Tax=Candidatus Merdisoma sp. JLR.KK006 TaxID=3112626 RepID=UPI002FEE6680|nr:chemotaxis protein CheW [Lachnospiraceae bacterium]
MSTEQMQNTNIEGQGTEAMEADIPMERYLTFRSDGTTMGVSTNYVIEILTDQSITELPMVPDYIKGIINMRGQIVPIIDIRARMGKFADCTDKSCIIVLEIDSTYVGIWVDGVEQVLDIDQTQISPIPVEDQQGLVDGMISLSSQEVLLFLNCQELIRTY